MCVRAYLWWEWGAVEFNSHVNYVLGGAIGFQLLIWSQGDSFCTSEGQCTLGERLTPPWLACLQVRMPQTLNFFLNVSWYLLFSKSSVKSEF